MPALTYEIGARNTQLKAAVSDSKKVIKDLSDWSKQQGGGANAAGKKGNMQLGMASMQAQDIAVQLQAGTKYSTIIAQQGSQIASIFGTKGMIVGGALAIGGALYTWADSVKSAWQETLKSFREFDAGVLAAVNTGGIADLDAAMAKLPGSITAIKTELHSIKGLFSGIGIGLGAMLGGDTLNERQLALMKERRTQEMLMGQVGIQRVALEEKAAAVMKLRAEERGDEADAMEAQLKMEQELFKAAALYRGETWERLKIAIEQRYTLAAQIKDQERIAELGKDCEEAAKKHAAALKEQAESAKELHDQIEGIVKKDNEARADNAEKRKAAEKELAQIGETALEEQTRLLKEYAELEQSAYEAQMTGQQNSDELKAELAKKQIELAKNGIELNKANLDEEEKRTKNMEVLGRAIQAGKLALENMETENMRKAVNEKLKTPQQRAAERRQGNAELLAVRQIAGRELDQQDAARRRAGMQGLTKEERDAHRKNAVDKFKGEQQEQKKANNALINIDKNMAKLAEKIDKV